MAKLERYDGDDVSFGSATSLSLSLSLSFFKGAIAVVVALSSEKLYISVLK